MFCNYWGRGGEGRGGEGRGGEGRGGEGRGGEGRGGEGRGGGEGDNRSTSRSSIPDSIQVQGYTVTSWIERTTAELSIEFCYFSKGEGRWALYM